MVGWVDMNSTLEWTSNQTRKEDVLSDLSCLRSSSEACFRASRFRGAYPVAARVVMGLVFICTEPAGDGDISTDEGIPVGRQRSPRRTLGRATYMSWWRPKLVSSARREFPIEPHALVRAYRVLKRYLTCRY